MRLQSLTSFQLRSSAAVRTSLSWSTLTAHRANWRPMRSPLWWPPTSRSRPVPASPSQVNTSAPGFTVRVVQARSDAALPTDNTTAENLIRGYLIDPTTSQPYVNHAPAATTVDPDVINWNQDEATAQSGDFQAPDHPDEAIPGIPGDETSTDNFSAELLTYLDLPEVRHSIRRQQRRWLPRDWRAQSARHPGARVRHV